MTNENQTAASAPQPAQASTPAPAATPQPSSKNPPSVNIVGSVNHWKVSGFASPRWLAFLAMFVRLIWPLAILGCGVALFVIIGASGWLWLVLGLIIVCATFARPTQPPHTSE